MDNRNNWQALLEKLVVISVEITGILINPPGAKRLILDTVHLAIFFGFWVWATPAVATAYFVCSVILNFGNLYICLGSRSPLRRLIPSHSQEFIFQRFRTLQGGFFFHYGMSYALFCTKTTVVGLSDNMQLALFSLGLLLIFAGFLVKISATWVVGLDIYYWRDLLFLQRDLKFTQRGVYKYLSNPMYGLGYLQVYGMAFASYSYIGFLGGIVMQLLIYMFYFTVEKPYVKLSLAKKYAA